MMFPSIDLLTLIITVMRERSPDSIFLFHGLLLLKARRRRGRASHLGPLVTSFRLGHLRGRPLFIR